MIYVTNSRDFCKFSLVPSNFTFFAGPHPTSTLSWWAQVYLISFILPPFHSMSCRFLSAPWRSPPLSRDAKPLHFCSLCLAVPSSTGHISISLLRPSSDITTFVKCSPPFQGKASYLPARSAENFPVHTTSSSRLYVICFSYTSTPLASQWNPPGQEPGFYPQQQQSGGSVHTFEWSRSEP